MTGVVHLADNNKFVSVQIAKNRKEHDVMIVREFTGDGVIVTSSILNMELGDAVMEDGVIVMRSIINMEPGDTVTAVQKFKKV